ncbi:MAG: O-methyltransferase [Polyangiaceae bacterium]|nr:O-methyltransferase [Polyangiaceae bacterium]
MSEQTWRAVDAFIAQHLVGHDPALDHALATSAAGGLPHIQVSAAQGKQLMLLARLRKARSILEIGTLGGYSTIWLARGLAPGGRIVTLEVNPKHAEVARGNLTHASLASVVDVRVGPALEALPVLAAEGAAFDMVFIDADKANGPNYFAWAVKLATPGAIVVVDNVVRDGAVIDASSSDPNVQGTRRLYEVVAAEPRVTATAVQTVGDKGYDGFLMAIVTG